MFRELNENTSVKFDVDFGSYAARDTFISRYVSKGADWHSILKFVGQSSFAVMRRYVQVEDKYLQEQMQKIG